MAWPSRTIDEIADRCLGKMLDKNKNKGDFRPYLRNLNVRWFDFDLSDVLEMRFEEYERERYTALKGDVLVCEGGYPGRAAIWEQAAPIHFQKAVHRVRFHEPARAKWFVYYLYFRDLEGSLRRHFNGAGIQHFTGEALGRFAVPHPPLSEVKRIVAILDEAFEGIRIATANAEKNLANARELFDSALTQHMEGARVGARVLTLADAVAADCSLSYGIVQPGADIADGLPIVRPVDLTGRRAIDLEGLKRIDPKLAAGYARTTLQGGEVLLCVRGTTGVAARAVHDLRGANVTRGIVPIRFNSDLIDQNFGFYQILSRRVQDQIKKATYGAALMQINIRDLRLVELIAPGKDKQREIAALSEKIEAEADRLIDVCNEQAASLIQVGESILARAFSGQLTASKGLAA